MWPCARSIGSTSTRRQSSSRCSKKTWPAEGGEEEVRHHHGQGGGAAALCAQVYNGYCSIPSEDGEMEELDGANDEEGEPVGKRKRMQQNKVMNLLGDLYKEYDERAVELGLYTVDHIGDCYMCAANLVKPLPNHVHVMVGFARNIIEIANTTLSPLGSPLSIRVGIHSGGLMSGVIGVHRRKFTLLGDTVNVASRMETTAITNTLQMSEHAYQQLRRERLAMLPEAAKGQSVGAGGCGTFPDMHGQGKSSCSMVRGSSAPPSLLASKQDERGAALTEQGCSMGSSMCVQKSKSLFSQEQLQPQQQGQRRPCQEEEKQQHCLCEQTGAQEKGGQNKPQEPESLVGGSALLIQGAVTSFYTAAPAEQSNRVQQPGSVDLGPAHPGNWLERKLDVKGKGIMKAYTYIGQK